MEEAAAGTVVALVKDLFFSVKLGNEVRRAGFTPRIVKSVDEFREAVAQPRVALGVIDLGAHLEADALKLLAGEAQTAGVPVIAFGPHKDVDALRDAQRAGLARVMANSLFHAQAAEMIRRYARQNAP